MRLIAINRLTAQIFYIIYNVLYVFNSNMTTKSDKNYEPDFIQYCMEISLYSIR